MFLNLDSTPTLVVVFVMIYNAAFGYSWGPIPWLYPPEILPLSIRSKGASLSTATNWAFNWLVGEMTPILQEWITWRLYLVHAFFCAASFVIGKSYLYLGPALGRKPNTEECTFFIPKHAVFVWRIWIRSLVMPWRTMKFLRT
jgi:sugar transport protein